MGSLPADSEQFLLIEDSIVEIEKLTTRVDEMMHNKVNNLCLLKIYINRCREIIKKHKK